jgi:hypothetical protein
MDDSLIKEKKPIIFIYLLKQLSSKGRGRLSLKLTPDQ